jgi:hypothetical protein
MNSKTLHIASFPILITISSIYFSAHSKLNGSAGFPDLKNSLAYSGKHIWPPQLSYNSDDGSLSTSSPLGSSLVNRLTAVGEILT